MPAPYIMESFLNWHAERTAREQAAIIVDDDYTPGPDRDPFARRE